MARQITNSQDDRTADILLSGFSIVQNLTYQEDTCSLTIKSGAKPSTGDEIIVLDGTTKLFGGINDQVKDQPLPGILLGISAKPETTPTR